MHRNGSVFRDSVPLWQARAEATASTRLVEQSVPFHRYDNGSKSRNLLPLLYKVVVCMRIRVDGMRMWLCCLTAICIRSRLLQVIVDFQIGDAAMEVSGLLQGEYEGGDVVHHALAFGGR